MRTDRHLSRRAILRAGMAAAVGGIGAAGLLACGEAQVAEKAATKEVTAAKAAEFDWKRYSGESIYTVFQAHPWSTAVQTHVPEFEEMTGIKVNYEEMPEQQALRS